MRWPITDSVRLVGKFVELTPVDPSADAPELFQALDHDRVWAHVPGRPATPDDFERGLAALAARPDWQPWTVRTTAGSVIGTTSYLDVSSHDARIEIGSTLYTPAVWATTVNPEVKLLLLRYAFDDLGVGRAQLKTDARNKRSQQAIARLGATYEGTPRRHFRRDDGTVRDSVVFSIIAEDWPGVEQRLSARLAAGA